MILDGKRVSKEIREKIKKEVKQFDKITLLVILVGDNSASQIYVHYKEKACKEVGINFQLIRLPESASEQNILQLIDNANNDEKVHGILVQLPLPKHLNAEKIINHINPDKDVDGLTVINQGRLLNNLDCIIPATPKGVITLLDYYKIDVAGKKAIVIGRSNLVGKPLALLLLQRNATVTIAHSKSNLEIVKNYDLIFSAVGRAKLIKKDMVKNGAIVIDIGISRIDDKVIGDVDFEEVVDCASYITPVPGGIGPMTIACLLENVVKSYKKMKGIL